MVVKSKQRSNAREQVVVAPTAVQLKTVRSSTPNIRSLPDGDVIVSHREYFADVNSTNPFTVVSFNINPGRVTMFPWLSNLAMNYERYKFLSLKVHFRTGAPTTSPGKLGIYADYDATDPAPTTKQLAYANRNFVDCPIWGNCTWTAASEDLRRLPSYYVYDGNTTEVDHALDLSDLGVLNVCTSMDPSPNLSGELFVEYVVQLMTPSPRLPIATPQPPARQTEDVSLSLEGLESVEPFGPSSTFFNAGITPLSDNLVIWASNTALQFVSDFYGIVSIVLQGTGAEEGPAWHNNEAGVGTTASILGGATQTISTDQTSIVLSYVVNALTGQYLTVYELFSFSTLVSMALKMSASKPGAHSG